MKPETSKDIHRTLGPVSDLERHLPPDWWEKLFNAVYLQTDGDVFENHANTEREVELLVGILGLAPGDTILDLCCGQGRHSLEFARRGFDHITGLDRSRYLIRMARRRARAANLDVKFREGDARKCAVGESAFDCVIMMGNSFGYFEREEDDLAVLTAIKRALRSNGRVAIDLTDGDWLRKNFEPRSWEWIDQNHFVCRERTLSSDGDRLVSREVVVHAEQGVIADQFYAERLYSRARMEELLRRAGFGDIQVLDELEAHSTRGTDVGMMTRRNLVSARAPAKEAARKPSRPRFPDVTVLLGDPRLPDMVKKTGHFAAEDLETVAKLKEALGSLPGYRFSYVDDHADLFTRLSEAPPEFVLNLCDEGFGNDALRELHVPAMLDVLNIPYSGAEPAALGLCYNKALVRAVADACDIPVPLETYAAPGDQAATIPAIFPALMKPCMGDSSIGITRHAVVHSPDEAVVYLSELNRLLPGRAVLVQEFLAGAEYSVGLIGNPDTGLTALPLLEVDYGGLPKELPKILGYESKWDPDSPYWTQIEYREARVDELIARSLADWSMTLFERLGCRDYARFDFRADLTGQVKLLEVNPNPGWCWDGKLNLMAGFAGQGYSDLLAMILEAAQRRAALTTAGRSDTVTLTAATA